MTARKSAVMCGDRPILLADWERTECDFSTFLASFLLSLSICSLPLSPGGVYTHVHIYYESILKYNLTVRISKLYSTIIVFKNFIGCVKHYLHQASLAAVQPLTSAGWRRPRQQRGPGWKTPPPAGGRGWRVSEPTPSPAARLSLCTPAGKGEEKRFVLLLYFTILKTMQGAHLFKLVLQVS